MRLPICTFCITTKGKKQDEREKDSSHKRGKGDEYVLQECHLVFLRSILGLTTSPVQTYFAFLISLSVALIPLVP